MKILSSLSFEKLTIIVLPYWLKSYNFVHICMFLNIIKMSKLTAFRKSLRHDILSFCH